MEVRQNQLISDGEIGKLTCMEFNDIFCANFWQINWNPPFCEHFIHNYQVFIQPQHCDIEIHKHHVNGGVHPGFPFFRQDNALVQRNLFGKHQPLQPAAEGIAKLNLYLYRRQSLVGEYPGFQSLPKLSTISQKRCPGFQCRWQPISPGTSDEARSV